jgi:hypothetical protein
LRSVYVNSTSQRTSDWYLIGSIQSTIRFTAVRTAVYLVAACKGHTRPSHTQGMLIPCALMTCGTHMQDGATCGCKTSTEIFTLTTSLVMFPGASTTMDSSVLQEEFAKQRLDRARAESEKLKAAHIEKKAAERQLEMCRLLYAPHRGGCTCNCTTTLPAANLHAGATLTSCRPKCLLHQLMVAARFS